MPRRSSVARRRRRDVARPAELARRRDLRARASPLQTGATVLERASWVAPNRMDCVLADEFVGSTRCQWTRAPARGRQRPSQASARAISASCRRTNQDARGALSSQLTDADGSRPRRSNRARSSGLVDERIERLEVRRLRRHLGPARLRQDDEIELSGEPEAWESELQAYPLVFDHRRGAARCSTTATTSARPASGTRRSRRRR